MVEDNINILILFIYLSLLVVTVICHDRHSFLGKIIFKSILSLMFFGVALLQTSTLFLYPRWVLVGLGLCLIGDVCMIFSVDIVFFAGLVAFVFGHLAYIAAFLSLADLSVWTIVGIVLVGTASAVFFMRLRSHLGRMKMPVAVYSTAICLMVTAAVTLAGDPRYSIGGRLMVSAGALAFYVSDLFVAREQFFAPRRINLLVGLPLYYVGQFLIAFSIGMLT